jgi:hypothetical protein
METLFPALLMSCTTPEGETVVNRSDEELGELAHLVVDVCSGKVAYAVLVRGGVFGLGERLHAVPWEAIELDPERRRYVLDVEKERLEAAPGFDDDHWPAMTDADWAAAIREFFR